jgi:hypothetical protein
MRAQRNALLCLAAVATLALASADAAFAQKAYSRGASPNIGASRPIGPRGGDGGGGGYRGGGWGATACRKAGAGRRSARRTGPKAAPRRPMSAGWCRTKW